MKRLIFIIAIFLLGSPGLAQIHFDIHADIPEDAAYVDSIIKYTFGRLELLLGPLKIDSLDIYVVTSEEKFDSLAGNTVPDWGAAAAIPFRHRIVIKSPLIMAGDKSLGELTAHELAHIALARATGYRSVPRWLDEGLAMYVSAEWGWSENLSMSWAVVLGSVIPLTEIEYLNRFEGERVRVAYSQSYLAFKYFLDTYGRSSFDILLESIRSGKSHEEAFLRAIGGNADLFEREFVDFLHRRYNLISLIFDSHLLWILLALLVILGFILARLRRKKKFSQLDEYDMLHSTDFDYGEVEKPDEDKPWD